MRMHQRSIAMFLILHVLLLLGVLVFIPASVDAAAADRIRACQSNSDCNEGGVEDEWLSVCENERCTNPFEQGCLKAMKRRKGHRHKNKINDTNSFSFLNSEDFLDGRVCNSDDEALGTNKNTENCIKPEEVFDYFEIRLSPGYWESATVLGWIFQILLSEVFGVPTTIEAGRGERLSNSSFYDRQSRFELPNSHQTYPYDQLVEADRVNGDCTQTDKPCAHVMTEVWLAGKFDAVPYQENGTILQSEPNGYSARFGFYVPLRTMERDGSFASYYGFQGDENKQKVADTFKQPTNWTDYCQLVSETNCTVDDGIAKRYPQTPEEESSYFVRDAYTGHFRTTFQNNCTANENCTGSAIMYRCDGSVYTDSQFYWNDIRLTPDGPLRAGSYAYSHMIQIYEAANATNSDVFMWYYEPDLIFEKYATSRGMKMKRVDFPNPTMDCYLYRATQTQEHRCSADIDVRRGSARGSCDFTFDSVPKLLSRGLETATAEADEFMRSPALAYLKDFAVPQYTMPEIFRMWEDLRMNHDHGQHEDGNRVIVDVEREGICQWVYDHLDSVLLKNRPRGYPRKFEFAEYSVLTTVGYFMGSITLIMALMTAALTYKWRGKREIKFAQVKVLYLVTLGHAFVAAAGVTLSSELEDFRCTLIQWFIRLGYSLALVPIFIKVSTINKLTRESRRLRRIQINDNFFDNVLFLTICILLVFLMAWTIIDPPRQELDYRAEDRGDNDDGDDYDQFFRVHIGCSSRSNIWEMAAFGWEFLLLASATVLTFQSREVIQELNESHWLAFMVYSHFLFIILRLLVTSLMFTGTIPSALALRISSLLLSFDALLSICIYFGPKFYKVLTRKKDLTRYSEVGSRNGGSNVSAVSGGRRGSNGSRGSRSSVGERRNFNYERNVSGFNVPRTKSGRIPRLTKKASNVSSNGSITRGSTQNRVEDIGL